MNYCSCRAIHRSCYSYYKRTQGQIPTKVFIFGDIFLCTNESREGIRCPSCYSEHTTVHNSYQLRHCLSQAPIVIDLTKATLNVSQILWCYAAARKKTVVEPELDRSGKKLLVACCREFVAYSLTNYCLPAVVSLLLIP